MDTRRGGTLIAIGGAALVLLSMLEVVWPAAVPDTRASFPFSAAMFAVVQVATGVADLLIATGLILLLTAGERIGQAWIRVLAWVMVVAVLTLVIGQAVEAEQGRELMAEAEDKVAPFFGTASLLWGMAATGAGIGLVRSQEWGRAGLWILTSGIAIFVVVLPTQFGAPPRIGDFALAIWAVTITAIGGAVKGANLSRATAGPAPQKA